MKKLLTLFLLGITVAASAATIYDVDTIIVIGLIMLAGIMWLRKRTETYREELI